MENQPQFENQEMLDTDTNVTEYSTRRRAFTAVLVLVAALLLGYVIYAFVIMQAPDTSTPVTQDEQTDSALTPRGLVYDPRTNTYTTETFADQPVSGADPVVEVGQAGAIVYNQTDQTYTMEEIDSEESDSENAAPDIEEGSIEPVELRYNRVTDTYETVEKDTGSDAGESQAQLE